MRALAAQWRIETVLTLRRGESLLLVLGIPLGMLVFFSVVDVLPTEAGTDPVDFLAPGIVALSVMSTAMVSLAIATGFERQYLVLKRLAVTPLGTGRLLAAKVGAVAAIEVLQVVLIVVVATALGWRPEPAVATAAGAVVLATAAFGGLGMLMAGTLRAEMTLALANAAYLVLLVLGGMVFPLDRLPGPLAEAARVLPGAALSELLRGAFEGAGASAGSWAVLAAWAVAAPALAAATFRWE